MTPHRYERWPLLVASLSLAGAGLALDLASASVAPYAVACLVLAAASFGAFLYAEGARHREWWHRDRIPDGPEHTAGQDLTS